MTSAASTQYPPRSHNDLKKLHHSIISSVSPDHHKQSLLYYILKDIPNSGVAEGFAQAAYLPEKYRIFIDGIWLLDRKQFEVITKAHKSLLDITNVLLS